MKKLFTALLLCILVALSLPALASEGDFTIDVQNGMITAYKGAGGAVVVPETINGVAVHGIGTAAFTQNPNITSVVLPSSLTHIGSSAFYFCENLASVTFPDGLQAIDDYAFFSCGKLTSAAFPPSLVIIDSNAFNFCNELKDIRLTGSVPVIGPDAFGPAVDGRVITVPADLKANYEQALGVSCQAGENAVLIAADDLVAFDAASGLITGYTGRNADVLLPSSIGGTAVKGVADKAFFTNPWVRRVTLSEGITSVGKQAFFGTRLSEVVLPATLLSIGQEAFAGCNLLSLALPEGLNTLGDNAFANGKFMNLRIPNSLTDLPANAFARNWALQGLVLPAGIKTIGENAFLDCDSLSYIIFEGYEPPAMAANAFLECDKVVDVDIAWDASRQQAAAMKDALAAAGLAGLPITVWRANPANEPPYPASNPFTLDEASGLVTAYNGNLEELTMYWNIWKQDGSSTVSVRGLGPGVFENANLKVFHVPHSETFEIIGDRAFKNSQLTRVYIFDSVTHIGAEAFAGCSLLTDIKLPDSIQEIGQGAFAGCDSLASLVLPAGAVITGDLGIAPEKIRIAANASDEQVATMAASLNLPWYLDLKKEGEAAAFVVMPDSFTPNPEGEFEFDATSGTITRYIGTNPIVVVPRSIGGVTVTGVAYPGFSSLTVQTVMEGTADNLGLQQVVLPETVRTISDNAFLNCSALKSAQIYGPIDLLGIRAFENCVNLEEITFHNGIREMGVYAFNMCESLKKIELGSKLQALPEGAFFGCGFEGELTLSTPQVELMAYKNNAKVTSVHVLNTVNDLEGGVFHGMTALQSVTFDRADAAFLGDSRFQFDEGAAKVSVFIPESATDAQLAAYVTKMNQNLLPGDAMVQRKNYDGSAPVVPAPDTAAQAAAEPAPVVTEQAAPASSGDGPAIGLAYVCVEAASGGISFDPAALGRYAIIFSADGTAVLTVAGTDLPALNYTVKEGEIHLDYYGTPLMMTPVEGGYVLDFMGQMLLTMKPE